MRYADRSYPADVAGNKSSEIVSICLHEDKWPLKDEHRLYRCTYGVLPERLVFFRYSAFDFVAARRGSNVQTVASAVCDQSW